MINFYQIYNGKEKLDYYEKYNDGLDIFSYLGRKHYGVFDPGDVSVLKNVLHIIKREPNLAFWYADVIINGRWEEAEPTIMKCPIYAYEYALDIIKGRWSEAEKYIMKDIHWAFYYAKHIIKGRWMEAEPYIMESDDDWRRYCHEFKLC